MSAYIVNDYHINYLVSFAANKGVRYTYKGIHKIVSIQNRNEIGQILKDENFKSVNYRYAENEANEAFIPHYGISTIALHVIKAVHCLRYQSCEHDNFEDSEAAKILKAIEAEAVRCIPGYSDAPWEITEPDYKAIKEKIYKKLRA